MKTQDQTKTVHVVRCFAGGNIIGSLFEDEHGQPLTRIGAIRVANTENLKTAERGHGFEYITASFTKPLTSLPRP